MMMTLALLALTAAQPEAPAACELEGVSDLDLVALRVAMVEQIESGTARPASADATLKAIETKAVACHPGDDAEADRNAATVAVARLTADAIGEKLSADGVDMAKVRAELAKTDRPVLEAFVAKKFDTPGVADMGERVTGVAGSDAPPAVRKLLGAYAFNAGRVTLAAPVVKPVER